MNNERLYTSLFLSNAGYKHSSCFPFLLDMVTTMITQKIDKYPEPPPYQMTTYSKPIAYAPVTFTPKEINDAKELGIMLGITEGLCLEHTPTGHFITILGWVDDKDVTSHNGKPRIVKAMRDRQGHQWETNYSVDELMLMEYKTVLEEIKP